MEVTRQTKVHNPPSQSSPPAAGASAGTARKTVEWLAPTGTIFIASACIMVVELLAGRLVSRYLGQSLHTWTAAIGVVLGGISLGNYIGGRLADRFQLTKTLTVLFLLSAGTCVLPIFLNTALGEWSVLENLSWPSRIFIHTTLTFIAPATALGTISPVIAKMALNQGRSKGRTIGNVYAWGTLGSIVGTYLAGFYLVAAMRVTWVIYLMAAMLAVLGLAYAAALLRRASA